MSETREQRAQRERAQQSWELVVLELPAPELLEAVRKLLRIKRFEYEAFAEALPGVVRRGAELDLAPIEKRLVELGVRAELRRSSA